MCSQTIRRSIIGLVILVFMGALGTQLIGKSSGLVLGRRSLQLSDSSVSAVTTYNLSFNYATTGTVGSLSILFCANGPFLIDACIAPSGFNAKTANLISQSGATGFSVSNNSTANHLILSRIPSVVGPVPAVYEFSNITNPSSPGSYYVRLQSYATNDVSGPAGDYGGIAFAVTNGIAINALVPPFLIFCTAITIQNLNCANSQGDYIDFGILSPTKSASGTSQMLIATNAVDGYSVTVDGTTLTSGNNVIAAISPADVSRPGTAQFGFNLRANSTPAAGNNPTGPGTSNATPLYNSPNFYRFVPGDTLVSFPKPDDVRQYTAAYIANVPTIQPPGVYVSTLTYICLANF